MASNYQLELAIDKVWKKSNKSFTETITKNLVIQYLQLVLMFLGSICILIQIVKFCLYGIGTNATLLIIGLVLFAIGYKLK